MGKVVRYFVLVADRPSLKNVFGSNNEKLQMINYIVVAAHQPAHPFMLYSTSWKVMFNVT